MTKSGGSKVNHLPSISQYIYAPQWRLRSMDINRRFYITGCFGISEGYSNQPSLFERVSWLSSGWVHAAEFPKQILVLQEIIMH